MPDKKTEAHAVAHIPTSDTIELRFTLTPDDQKISAAALENVGNEILKSIASKTGIGPSRAWFEAGGYAKWSKSAAKNVPTDQSQ